MEIAGTGMNSHLSPTIPSRWIFLECRAGPAGHLRRESGAAGGFCTVLYAMRIGPYAFGMMLLSKYKKIFFTVHPFPNGDHYSPTLTLVFFSQSLLIFITQPEHKTLHEGEFFIRPCKLKLETSF